MNNRSWFAAVVVLVALGSGCELSDREPVAQVTLELPGVPFQYNVEGASDELVTLGRVLFYDPKLSINNSVSCGSCHKQALAFADNTRFSRGFENKLTTRNSMPIQNIVSDMFSDSSAPVSDSTVLVGGYLPGQVSVSFLATPTMLFWDGRENSLQTMVTEPILNHIEMGMQDIESLARKLSAVPYYQQLVLDAFESDQVSPAHIALGLSAFLISVRSTESKFDLALSSFNNNSISLSANEEIGRQLFFEKFNCNTCHSEGGFANIGLGKQDNDIGLASVTGINSDRGKFKIPSLRNIALTGPYMHDGRFDTLDEVLDHYSTGVVADENLDFRLKGQDGKPLRLNMTQAEKNALIAFLNTLTDYRMITDKRFDNPFKQN